MVEGDIVISFVDANALCIHPPNALQYLRATCTQWLHSALVKVVMSIAEQR
jgi:hypothetical protein